MPFWRIYYHLVWATKNRLPVIDSTIEPRLFAYLVNKAKESGVIVYEINGWTDHIHMIVSIPPKHAVATIVKRLKGASAYDLNQSGSLDAQFNWQRGYGVLTLGERQREKAEAYVRNQKEHHSKETTNIWLERCAEYDEGPQEQGIEQEIVPHIIRESRATYQTMDKNEFPF